MQQKRNLFEELKFQLNNGTMTNKLVIINICVFLLIHLLYALEKISGNSLISVLIEKVFTLEATLIGSLSMPWAFVTSIFSHIDLMHVFLISSFFISQEIFLNVTSIVECYY